MTTPGIFHRQIATRIKNQPAWIAGHPWQSLYIAAVSLLVLSTLTGIAHSFALAPLWDEWAEVLWLKAFYAGHWHLSDLWRQHNEHRILLPRLIVLLDWFVFRGTRAFVLILILLLQAAYAWLFIRVARPLLRPELRVFYAGAVVVFLFSGAQMENFVMTLQTQVILVFLLGTLAVWCLLESMAASRAGEEKQAGRWFAGALAAAVGATCSLASGLMIWPTLLLLAAALRLRARRIAALAATAAFLWAVYLRGYHTLPDHPLALGEPLKVLLYTAGLISLPIARTQPELGAAFGLLELALTGWLVLELLRERDRMPRILAFFTGVMIFVVTCAVLTAIGRAAMGDPGAENTNRYATWASVFWVCLSGVLLIDQRLPWAGRKTKETAVVTALIACFCTIILPAHIAGRQAFINIGRTSREASLALVANVCDAETVRPVFPDPPFACESADFLRARGWSIFAPQWARETGLPSRYRVLADSSACSGTVEGRDIVESAQAPGLRLSGWAWDKAANRTPQRVVFVDDSGMVRGAAGFTRSRPDVTASLHSRMDLSGWFGFAAAPERAIQAYALLSDGASLCRILDIREIRSTACAVYRHGTWIIDSDKSGRWEPADRTLHFGLDGDLPVAGDWDGSGVVRAGVYRNGEWLLDWNNNGQWDDGDRRFPFGLPGDIPIVGDWNHTGVTKVGVFRNGAWYLDWLGEQAYTKNAREFTFGLPGDFPVAGDWDGSGKIRIGVYRRGVWHLDIEGSFRFTGREKVVYFGLPGDRPVTGDWNGLGTARLGVVRDGVWFVDYNGKFQRNGGGRMLWFGAAGDIPVAWQ